MEFSDLLNNSLEKDDSQSPSSASPLKSLKIDLDFYSDSIKEVSTEMLTEGFTLYPIFIAHQHEVKLGELILDRDELGTNWSINASSMEEFVEKGVIEESRKAYFEQKFKNSSKYMCLFVVVPEGANFVFYPYK